MKILNASINIFLRILVLIGWATIIFLTLFFIFLFYIFWIEPFRIEVTYHNLYFPISHSLKIAHLSDLHMRHIGRRERKVIKILEKEKPDLIVITGDWIIQPYRYDKVLEFLKHIKAPYGVFGVKGNWENAVGVSDALGLYDIDEKKYYEDVGFNLLLNEKVKILNDFYIIGFNDLNVTNKEINRLLASIPKKALKLALFHHPRFFKRIAGKIELAFSGHTHGGQVIFPFIGPLYIPVGSENFLSGWYEISNSKMYVNRGIGNSIFEARFKARPEVAIITLTNNKSTLVE